MARIFIIEKENRADFKVFVVDKDYHADLKFFYVDKDYHAKWRKDHSLKGQLKNIKG